MSRPLGGKRLEPPFRAPDKVLRLPFGGVLVLRWKQIVAWECKACGSVFTDPVLHIDWHKENNDRG